MKISQSFIKDMRGYLLGKICGPVVQAKYIDKNLPDLPSDAMKQGQYFEYLLYKLLTGKDYPNRAGNIPQPEFMVSKISEKRKLVMNAKLTDAEIIDKYNFGPAEMYEEYRRAHERAQMAKEYFDRMKITVISIQVHMEDKTNEGHIDIVALYNGEEVIIDVKYSGLIDDQWSEHGWMWTTDQKRYHGTQAIHYGHLGKRPFYFFVMSSAKADWQARFFRVKIEDFARDEHFKEAKELKNRFELEKKIGFTVHADLKRCNACPLRGKCEYRLDHPRPEDVVITQLN